MRSHWIKLLLAGFFAVLSLNALAGPVVIYDSGNTLPLPAPNQPIRFTLPVTAPTDQPAALPVKTPEMQPGRVTPRNINRPALVHPVFIVGADNLSIKWLRLYRQKLKELQANGIAVNVETDKQLQQLIKAAGGIAISPVPGTAISRQLRLNHYPALVSRTRIEQ